MSTLIVVGHYGSGKSEFAANYALMERAKGKDVVVADVDIVNPYFRTRELQDLFESRGIRILSSNFRNEYNLDTPALNPGIQECFVPGDRLNIVDAGGDAAGAHVLARFSGGVREGEYEMWLTVNANRPMTDSCGKVRGQIGEIEAASGLRVTGLVNTTHMLRETGAADIMKGNRLAREVAGELHLPVVYNAVPAWVCGELDAGALEGEILPVELLLRQKWL
ncbi:MAG: ATP-binding protein [Oscillospiraceae bacterium]|nr:ATP-binding protein [Oscillospiraceae bacterium]